jgi:membrane protein DedA with SNARE-associated domain
MDPILHWISQYGYGAIFALLALGIVGLPVPDETLLVFCGYLIFKGRLQPLLGWLSAVGGSVCGISLSYVIGRTAGHGFVSRYGRYIHFTEERLVRVKSWFNRLGHWLLTFGYFILGVRHFTALVAGMSELRYGTFATYAYPGAALWVTTFLALGYFLGDNWRVVIEAVHRYSAWISVVFVVAAIAIWSVRRKRAS